MLPQSVGLGLHWASFPAHERQTFSLPPTSCTAQLGRVGCRREHATGPRLQAGLGQRNNLTAGIGPQNTSTTCTPTSHVLPAGSAPFLRATPSHRVRPRGWDTWLSCHRVTVTPTCHLTCGLRGRARRGRATPEPHWHPGTSGPHDLANLSQGRMSPWPGLPEPQQPWGWHACRPPPPQRAPLHQATQGVPGKPILNKTCLSLFRTAS